MRRPPASANGSEWTTTVEAAVQTELLRRSRLLKWAVALSLLVGGLAVWLAIALRGVTWEEVQARLPQAIAPEVQRRLAPVLTTQITQGQAQIDMSVELGRLEGELKQLRADIEARRAARDPALASVQRRMRQLEQALNEAYVERARLAARIDGLTQAPGSGPRP